MADNRQAAIENQMGDPEVLTKEDEEIAEILNGMRSPKSLQSQHSIIPETPSPGPKNCASLLDFIEIIWKGLITLKVMNSFFLHLLMRKRQLAHNMPQQLKIMKGRVSLALQKITKHYHGKISSIGDLEKYLQEVKLYTIFTCEIMTETELENWLKLFKKHITEQSSSSENTATTSMSFTTANIQDSSADVPEYGNCNNEDGLNELDALFAASTSTSNTGTISQTISRPTKGKLYSWKTPGENGFRLIKMDIYDVNDISNVDKKVSKKNKINPPTHPNTK